MERGSNVDAVARHRWTSRRRGFAERAAVGTAAAAAETRAVICVGFGLEAAADDDFGGMGFHVVDRR